MAMPRIGCYGAFGDAETLREPGGAEVDADAEDNAALGRNALPPIPDALDGSRLIMRRISPIWRRSSVPSRPCSPQGSMCRNPNAPRASL